MITGIEEKLGFHWKQRYLHSKTAQFLKVAPTLPPGARENDLVEQPSATRDIRGAVWGKEMPFSSLNSLCFDWFLCNKLWSKFKRRDLLLKFWNNWEMVTVVLCSPVGCLLSHQTGQSAPCCESTGENWHGREGQVSPRGTWEDTCLHP